MIAPVIAAFFAGVFATLGVIFSDFLRLRLFKQEPRKLKLIEQAGGDLVYNVDIREGELGHICAELLVLAARDAAMTEDETLAAIVAANRYNVRITWRMAFKLEQP